MSDKKDPIEKAIESKSLVENLFDLYYIWLIIVSVLVLMIFLGIGIAFAMIVLSDEKWETGDIWFPDAEGAQRFGISDPTAAVQDK